VVACRHRVLDEGHSEQAGGTPCHHAERDGGQEVGGGARSPAGQLVPRPLGGQADGGNGDPGHERKAQAGVGAQHPRHDLDPDGRAQVQREAGNGVVEGASHQEGEAAPQDQERDHGQQGAAGTERGAGGDQRERGSDGDEQRLVQDLELGDAEVELALEDRQAREDGAEQEHLDAPAEGGGRGPGLEPPLPEHEPQHQGAQPPAGDELQMGGAPQRHVDPVGLVPQVVERERHHRADAEGAEEEGGPRDAQGPHAHSDALVLGVGPVEGGEDDGDHRGEHEAVQPDEDQRVRGREQLVVATLVDVPGHVPVEADDDDEQHDQPAQDSGHGPARIAGEALQGVTDLGEEEPERVGLVGSPEGEQGEADQPVGRQRQHQPGPGVPSPLGGSDHGTNLTSIDVTDTSVALD
jgi:hypothetical protein